MVMIMFSVTIQCYFPTTATTGNSVVAGRWSDCTSPGENGTEISVKFHPNFSDIAKYQ